MTQHWASVRSGRTRVIASRWRAGTLPVTRLSSPHRTLQSLRYSLQCLVLFARTSTYPKQRQVQISSIIFLPLSSCRSQLPVPPTIGGRQYPPQSAPAQATQGISNFVDGSGPIFSMYMDIATEEDKKMAENWKADADGILIFVRPYRLI